jgi:D-sedoheptulose 7-phosphate isomerase
MKRLILYSPKREGNNMEPMKYLEELIERYPVLSSVKEEIKKSYELLEACYENGGKLLIAGNGGSCADAEHIVGELMKGFVKRRSVSDEFKEALKAIDPELGSALGQKLQGGLPAIALTGHPGLSTAFLNDVDGEMIFAQQTYGYGKKGDVLLGISTSGNSKNVMYAMTAAKALGMKTIGLTGKDGGQLKHAADVTIVVPETETFKIQELHLPVYHALCLMLEERFF